MTSLLGRGLRAVSAPFVRSLTVTSLAATAVLAVAGTAAAAAPGDELTNCHDISTNLIVNCGFEDGTNGWYYLGGVWPGPNVGSTDVGAGAHSGAKVGYLGADSADWISFHNPVAVVAGKTYTFGTWWRTAEDGRPGLLTVDVDGPVADVEPLSAPVEGTTGWAALSGGSFRATASGEVTLRIRNGSSATVQLDDAALFARAAQTYSVSYDANAPEAELEGDPPADGSFTSGDSPYVVAEPDELFRFGYEFTGWNTRADGSGDDYQPGATLSPAEDVTLYAQWRLEVFVGLEVSALTQVYRTTDPQTLYAFSYVGPDDVGAGIIRFKHDGVLIGTVRTNDDGEAAMRVPTSLPLGRTSFTAEFTPTSRDLQSAVSDPADLTIARVSTATQVTLRQQTLSAADRKQYKVRSAMSVAVQVVGTGTRTPASGAVAINVNGRVTTLVLINGRAKSALVPTAAGAKTVFATYRPSTDFWVRSTGRAEITVR